MKRSGGSPSLTLRVSMNRQDLPNAFGNNCE
jgi:hypothetical protein